MRGREVFDAVLDHGTSDRERVDIVGLAGPALTAPKGAHPLRRDTHDLLAGDDQRLLKTT